MVGFITVLTSSDVAAFMSLSHLVPQIAAGIGVDNIIHDAHEACAAGGMLRAVSPLAGVIIVKVFAKENFLEKRRTVLVLMG